MNGLKLQHIAVYSNIYTVLVRLCQYYNMNSVETVKVEYNNKISTAIQLINLILKKMKSTYRHKTWSKSLPYLEDHTNTQLFKLSIQNR